MRAESRVFEQDHNDKPKVPRFTLQEIGWQSKEDARRVVVITTDSGYHFAGDGLVREQQLYRRFYQWNKLLIVFGTAQLNFLPGAAGNFCFGATLV